MTDIEQKALALLGEVSPYKCEKVDHAHHAYLCAALRLSVERHEAFKQDASRVMAYFKALYPTLPMEYDRFIIPAPKPDPLVDAMNDIGIGVYENIKTEYADTLRADLVRRFRSALDARGFEIREKGQ